MRLALRGALWIALYVFVSVSPLVFAAIGVMQPGRSFATDFSVALGFVGLAMMGLQFALIARFEGVASPFGMDALIQFHRQIAYVALAFILAHPILLFVTRPETLRLLHLPTAPWRARCAVASTACLLALVATSVWRKRLRIRYEVWQLLHGVLAVLIIVLALAHVGLVRYYVARPWQRALWVAMSATVVGLLGWVRIVKPLLRYRRPWRVEEVIPERGNAWTLVLRPDGHEGFAFEPGQFGWIMVGRSPFALTQHPFSFSSSAEEAGRISFTIKARGDFTRSIASVKPGTRAYVDGPHGVFSPDRSEGPGFVLIAGGVGITPLISMVRTMAARGDVRPIVLFYANRDWEGVTFREELEALAAAHPHLRVVHVLEHPPDGWTGEKGYIDAAMLERHLPPRYKRYQFFICGPGPMMDAMERALAAIGVPADRINTERFDMV
jgi:predicted ferric reductase